LHCLNITDQIKAADISKLFLTLYEYIKFRWASIFLEHAYTGTCFAWHGTCSLWIHHGSSHMMMWRWQTQINVHSPKAENIWPPFHNGYRPTNNHTVTFTATPPQCKNVTTSHSIYRTSPDNRKYKCKAMNTGSKCLSMIFERLVTWLWFSPVTRHQRATELYAKHMALYAQTSRRKTFATT